MEFAPTADGGLTTTLDCGCVITITGGGNKTEDRSRCRDKEVLVNYRRLLAADQLQRMVQDAK